MKKNLLLIFCLLGLISCSNEINKLKNFDYKNHAIVMGGCVFTGSNDNKEPKTQQCIMTWEQKGMEENKIKLTGNMDLQYVKPGIYEFSSFIAKNNKKFDFWQFEFKDLKNVKYQKFTGQISMLNDLVIRSGDVIYIGNLNIDVTKSKNALLATKIMIDQDKATEFLNLKYPKISSKLKLYKMSFTNEAKFIQNLN